MNCSTPGFPALITSQNLVRFMSIDAMMLPNHLILCHPLLLSSIFPSIRVFSSELALLIRWPKYQTFSFSISPSNEYSGLTSCKINCFGLLVVQGTHKSLLQHHNSKASILRCSAFFMAQLSQLYMSTAKTIVLAIQTSVCKVMSLLFNTVQVCHSFPSKERLLISQTFNHTLILHIVMDLAKFSFLFE